MYAVEWFYGPVGQRGFRKEIAANEQAAESFAQVVLERNLGTNVYCVGITALRFNDHGILCPYGFPREIFKTTI